MAEEVKKQEQVQPEQPKADAPTHPKHDIAEMAKLARLLEEGKTIPDYLIVKYGQKMVQTQKAELEARIKLAQKSVADKIKSLTPKE